MSGGKSFEPHEWDVSALFVYPVSRGDRRIRAGLAQDQPKIRSGLSGRCPRARRRSALRQARTVSPLRQPLWRREAELDRLVYLE